MLTFDTVDRDKRQSQDSQNRADRFLFSSFKKILLSKRNVKLSMWIAAVEYYRFLTAL